MFDTLKKWKYVQFILFQKLIRINSNFFRTENKLKPHVNLIRKYVKKSGIGIGIGNVMPSQKVNPLKFHQYIMSDKMRNNTYADLESFTKKIDRWMSKQSGKIINNKFRGTYSLQIFNVNCMDIL